MNYLLQFLQSFLLIFIYSDFGFSMDGQPRKYSALNPNAEAFYPRGQFISTLPEIHSPSEQQIANEDEHEALSILPKFLFDWEKNDEIEDVNQKEREEYHFNPQREEAGSSQGTHLNPQMEERGSSQDAHLNPQMEKKGSNQGTHLSPRAREEAVDYSPRNIEEAASIQKAHLNPQREEAGSNQGAHLNPKLNEREKDNPVQIERNKVNPANPKINIPLKFGSIPDNLLTSKHEKIEPKKLFDNKHLKVLEGIKDEWHHEHSEKFPTDKAGTLGHEISKGIEGEKREIEGIHGDESPKIIQSASDSKGQKIHWEKSPKITQSASDSDSNSEKKIEKVTESPKSASSSQKEEQQQPKESEASNIKPGKMAISAGSKQRRKERKQQQEAAKKELKKEILESDGKDAAATSNTLDKSNKEKLINISAAKSPSSSSSSSRKGKQQHSQKQKQQSSAGDGGGNISPHTHSDSGSVSPSHSTHMKQPARVEKKSALKVPSRIMKEISEGASHAIPLRDTGESQTVDSLAHEKFAEDNPFYLVEIDQDQRQDQLLVKEQDEKSDKFDDENKKQLENINQQGSQPSTKSKGKSKVVNAKEMKKWKNEKEKEEKKLLREAIAVNTKEMFRKGIDNAAEQRWVQEQLRTVAEDLERKNKELAKSLGHSRLLPHRRLLETPLESSITKLLQGHGEASSGSASGGSSVANNPKITILPESASPLKILQELNKSSTTAEAELLLRKNRDAEGEKKFNLIKNILKNLQKKLNEIEEFKKYLKKQEQIWVEEKSRKFVFDTLLNVHKEKILERKDPIFAKATDYKNLIDKCLLEKEKLAELDKKIEEFKKKNPAYINLIDQILILMEKGNLTEVNKKIEELKKKNPKGNEGKIAQNLIKMLSLRKNIEKFEKEIEKFANILMKEYKQKFNSEELKIEEKKFQEKMEKPLTYLWTAYNLVLKILNEHWREVDKNKFAFLNRPYHFISTIFGITLYGAGEDKEEFNNTLKATLEQMLIYRNIYSNIGPIKGELVHEKLNCFDELKEKINWLTEERKKNGISENHVKHMETFGKFFKEELNQTFHEVFRFIMVGIDQLPDVWDQMVLVGITRLSNWLPIDRKERFNEIWVQIYEYYEEEKLNLKWLSHNDNDKMAMKILDLFPDEEYVDERLKEQLPKIWDLSKLTKEKFASESGIVPFMMVAFGHIMGWIRSINLLLKIEKREKDSLLFLKCVYEKYWFMVYYNRFNFHFLYARQYYISREKNRTENLNISKEVLPDIEVVKTEEVEPIFKQIEATDEPGILDEMMTVIETIEEVVKQNKIVERFLKYQNDKDFLDSIYDENANRDEYERRLKELNAKNSNADDEN